VRAASGRNSFYLPRPNVIAINSLLYSIPRIFLASPPGSPPSPTRIAIVEHRRNGGLSAGALIERFGIAQANASQHLAMLRAKNILVNRKPGNQVFYSIRDPLIEVLDIMRRCFHAHMTEVLAERLRKSGRTFLLSGARDQPAKLLH
jgi:ArsR family transcriptional regulator